MMDEKHLNIRNTAQALYLLGLANDSPAYLGSDITWPQYAVLKSTLRADTAELKPASELEEPLRTALSQSKARLSDLETTIAAAFHATTATIHATNLTSNTVETSATTLKAHVSTATADLIALEFSRTFGERNLPAGIAETIASAEKVVRQHQSRVTLTSFAPPPPKTNPMNLISPDSPIPQEYGGKIHTAPLPPKMQSPTHNGLDITLKKNSEVRAIASGNVVFSGPFRGYGNLIVIEHPASYFSVYGFLDTMKVAVGDAVTTGQNIGAPGSLATNNQGFHFELRKNELPAEPRDLAGSKELLNLIAPGGKITAQGQR
jgi:murein DD-endopeptidase MepM/ murein hydrolase activator NlpD